MKRKEESLTEEEKRALRGSKFAPLPCSLPQQPPRLAHPGGPLTTNKAAALAKFLHRKLQDPNGLDSIDPQLVELAVKNAKDAVLHIGGSASSSGRHIKHVDSFGDSEDSSEEEKVETLEPKKQKTKKHKKEKKKRKKHKVKDQEGIIVKNRKKMLKV